MDVIKVMLENLQVSDLVALGALGVSILSLLVTLVATRISRDAVEDARIQAKEARVVSIEREKADLLQALSDEVSRMERTRIDIEALQADYLGKPAYVQELLANYTGIFGSYLDGVKQGISDTQKLYDQIETWTQEATEIDFIRARTEQHRYSRDFDIVASQANKLVGAFQEKMDHASGIGRGIPPG